MQHVVTKCRTYARTPTHPRAHTYKGTCPWPNICSVNMLCSACQLTKAKYTCNGLSNNKSPTMDMLNTALAPMCRFNHAKKATVWSRSASRSHSMSSSASAAFHASAALGKEIMLLKGTLHYTQTHKHPHLSTRPPTRAHEPTHPPLFSLPPLPAPPLKEGTMEHTELLLALNEALNEPKM